MRVRQDKPLEERLKEKAAEIGFAACGVTRADAAPAAGERLRQWLADGSHGSMIWMEERAHHRESPASLWPGVRSVIALGMSYAPAADPLALAGEGEVGRISVYAQGGDYHDLIKRKLKELARWLVGAAPGADVKVFVDTAPVMEKPLSEAAGLGWQGKHTNLVSRSHAMLANGESVTQEVLDVSLLHHEKIDGTGYPKGLKGDAISLAARMGAICDVYDALTSARPYKEGWTPLRAATEMHAAGIGPGVAVADALMVLCRAERKQMRPVGQHEQAGFLARQEFLDHCAAAGHCEDAADRLFGLLVRHRHRHALARSEPVGLDYHRQPEVAQRGEPAVAAFHLHIARGRNVLARAQIFGEPFRSL